MNIFTKIFFLALGVTSLTTSLDAARSKIQPAQTPSALPKAPETYIDSCEKKCGMPINVTANSYITEIINNTDGKIDIRDRSARSTFFYVTQSTSLKTNNTFQHVKPIHSSFISISPQTKNIITGLKVPRFAASATSTCCIDRLYSGNYIDINFYLPYDPVRCPLPFFALRQKGNFFDILKGEGLRSIFLDNIQQKTSIPFNLLINEKIVDGATYTIEINQITKNICHSNIPLAGRKHLAKNTVDIIIKKNNIPPTPQIIERPHAYIQSFSQSNITIAIVDFKPIPTAQYINNFYNFMRRNEFIKKNAIMKTDYGTGYNVVNFTFYSDITQNEFQALLDQANNAKLDY